jgi:multiple sugar transport system ATP-binding protein
MVVMKLGVVQQIGEPQHIYDDPDNLFVANFLGTPPINIFTGEIINHKLYIGDEVVCETEFEDQLVYAGIRPEGFVYNENGKLTLQLQNIEVMGRDKSIISTHAASTKPTIRSIIDSEIVLPTNATELKFDVKPNKLFLFNRESEMRLK